VNSRINQVAETAALLYPLVWFAMVYGDKKTALEKKYCNGRIMKTAAEVAL